MDFMLKFYSWNNLGYWISAPLAKKVFLVGVAAWTASNIAGNPS